MSKKIKVAINGLGRIGKCLTRLALKDQNFELVCINSGSDSETVSNLLKYDSVHGRFEIPINFNKVQITSERDINRLNWEGIDIVFECTGSFNKRHLVEAHLNKGASRVIVSAPCESADRTIIYGVNHRELQPQDKIVSIGSCTSNCFAPVCYVMHHEIGIERGFMTTIHSYTNDQKILDGNHKDPRRGRAAAMSMVPTSTGATKIMGEIFPELKGKISGSCVRVPTANVSLIDFTFQASNVTNEKDIKEIFSAYSKNLFKNIVAIEEDPLVSVDFSGRSESSIIDLLETKVIDGRFVRILAWYDNEWGFSNRMLDVAKCFYPR